MARRASPNASVQKEDEVMHQVDHAARGGDKNLIELFLTDYERRRYFQDHEIVAAYLSENAAGDRYRAA